MYFSDAMSSFIMIDIFKQSGMVVVACWDPIGTLQKSTSTYVFDKSAAV